MDKQEINSIFDSNTYIEVYERDILEANSEVIISSPGINENKVKGLLTILNDNVDKNLSVIVYTLKAECYSEDRVSKTKKLIKQLMDFGIAVYENSEIYEHYAIFDKEIVWYGSVNLLSREKTDDNIIRLVSKEIAQELMDIYV